MKRLILLVFLALVIFSAIYALRDTKEFTTSSDQAYQAFMAGESLRKSVYYHEAIPEYEKAVRIDSNFAVAYLMLAELNIEFGNREQAQMYIEKARSLFPLITPKEQLMIKTYGAYVNNDLKNYRDYIHEFVKLYPDDIKANQFQAELYMRDRDYKNAIVEYEKIIQKDAGYAAAYNMLGYINYYAGNFDEALLNVRKYSMVASKEANPHDSYGEILMYLGRYDEAIKEFEAANKIKPDLDFILRHLGMAHRSIGKYRDAIGYFERAREFSRSEIFAARIDEDIAYTHFLAGDKELAVEILEPIFREHPEWTSVVTFLGFFSADIGKMDLAEQCRVTLDSMDVNTFNYTDSNSVIVAQDMVTAKIALQRGEYDKSIRLYTRALNNTRRPSTVFLRFLLAQPYIKTGKYESAKKYLYTNLEENPNDPLSLYSLARIYKIEGNTQKQKQMLLTYLSVMSGADDDIAEVAEARRELESLTEYSES